MLSVSTIIAKVTKLLPKATPASDAEFSAAEENTKRHSRIDYTTYHIWAPSADPGFFKSDYKTIRREKCQESKRYHAVPWTCEIITNIAAAVARSVATWQKALLRYGEICKDELGGTYAELCESAKQKGEEIRTALFMRMIGPTWRPKHGYCVINAMSAALLQKHPALYVGAMGYPRCSALVWWEYGAGPCPAPPSQVLLVADEVYDAFCSLIGDASVFVYRESERGILTQKGCTILKSNFDMHALLASAAMNKKKTS